jgi:hypothetical protein
MRVGPGESCPILEPYNRKGGDMKGKEEFGIKQFVAVVQASSGSKFMVFTTGSPKHYMFSVLDNNGCQGDLMWSVAKADLRDDIRRMLAHGYGNCVL